MQAVAGWAAKSSARNSQCTADYCPAIVGIAANLVPITSRGEAATARLQVKLQ